MKTTRLLQIPIVLTLLFGSVGTNQPVRASTDPQSHAALQIQSSVSITVLPALIAPNESATVTVSLSNVPAEGYTSAEFNCIYPADLVQVSDIVLTGLFGPDSVPAISGPRDGLFIVGVAGSRGNRATAGGPIFTFHVKALATGQVELICTTRVSDGSNVLTGIGSASAGLMVMEATVTPTIAPTACDKAEFVADINVPPGTVMLPGTQFTKTWRLKNVGSCIWTTSYRVKFVAGEQMNAPASVRFPVNVAPGQTFDISLYMTAPSTLGSQRGYWILHNDKGEEFGIGLEGNQPWFVDIVVSNATPSATPEEPINSPTPSVTPAGPTDSPTPTPTSAPTATPMPNTYFDFVAQAHTATWSNAAGQLPYPGIDGSPDGFAFKVDNPRLETGAVDTRPGLLMVPQMMGPQNAYNLYIQGSYPPIHVQSGDRFQSTIGCEGGATNCYLGFRLDYQVDEYPYYPRTFWG
ncbi:MAG TPA: NBR1-Ig-like domain-containing protein, partial [Anaerolineales bacterium]|nr:NBR1-Ig-like domain-containing protein [Anaerolineales bacterium]